MEDKVRQVCDFCDTALTAPWFRLGSFRCEGFNVSRSFEFRMCGQCYPKLHYPLRKAAFDLMRQSFLEAVTQLRQDLQKAVEDKVTTIQL